MKTLAELEAKIAEHFKQEEAPQEANPDVRVYGFVCPRADDAEEQLVTRMWADLFAPLVDKNVTIFWRRRLGFQRTIPSGMSLSCRAQFVQGAP